MTPRKSPHGKVAKWAYDMYKQKKKRIAYGPYACPRCGKNLLRINISKQAKEVSANCSCGFNKALKYSEIFEPVDYYNKMLDQIRQNKRVH